MKNLFECILYKKLLTIPIDSFGGNKIIIIDIRSFYILFTTCKAINKNPFTPVIIVNSTLSFFASGLNIILVGSISSLPVAFS